jgi:hypothetical protein
MRLGRDFERAVMTGGTVLALITTMALVLTLILLATQTLTPPRIEAATTQGPSVKVSTCSPFENGACAHTPLPTAHGVPYSHSWYISSPSSMPRLAREDALWLNKESALVKCVGDFLTVLDFAHPTTKNSDKALPLDHYAMTLFGRNNTSTYRQIEEFAEQYIDTWHATASSCPRLRLALGTSNYAECAGAVGTCNLNTAGQYWDVVVHDVMQYVSAKGYSGQITGVWVADDLEGSWDPWSVTSQFLSGVRDQEHTYSAHANLVDYGDANAGACSESSGSCAQPWSKDNIYSAAWGMGWNVPVPETYTNGTTRKWVNLALSYKAIRFAGIMTECAGPDPLPTGTCDAGGGNYQWSPTLGYTTLASVHPGAPIPYATNMQWPK